VIKETNIAVVSDIHLGHPKNKAREIVKNLRNAFPDNSETAKLDIIFLAGDIFNDLLSLPDEDVIEIDLWISSLLRLCKKHNIILRVLEGTPSHDWKQSERFLTINNVAQIGTDLKYIKDLSIEYIESLNLHVLYVPDEWEDNTEKTLNQVQKLLDAKGLTQVDIAVMHGQFEYQLPPFIKAQKHSSDAYHKLVKELIFIGHIHTHSRNGKIIAQGSFDRLAHGEEEPKGHVRVSFRSNKEHVIKFVENTNAKKFVTVDCIDMDLEATLAKINQQVITLPELSYVRVEGNYSNPIFSNMEMLIRLYPTLIWSKSVIEEKDEKEKNEEAEEIFVPITITKENIVGLLLDRLVSSGVEGVVLNTSKTIIEEVM
jgi:DNA repair exonuclease SbcCD nuclease subunit